VIRQSGWLVGTMLDSLSRKGHPRSCLGLKSFSWAPSKVGKRCQHHLLLEVPNSHQDRSPDLRDVTKQGSHLQISWKTMQKFNWAYWAYWALGMNQLDSNTSHSCRRCLRVSESGPKDSDSELATDKFFAYHALSRRQTSKVSHVAQFCEHGWQVTLISPMPSG